MLGALRAVERAASRLAVLVVLGLLSCRTPGAARTDAAGGAAASAGTHADASAPSCFDSDVDAPEPRSVRGYVRVTDATGTTTKIDDACESEHYVREGRCPEVATSVDAQLGYYFLAYCERGCRDGACMP